jgi:hypothetical protein
VNHRVAVWTNWAQVSNWIDTGAFLGGRQGRKVMNMDDPNNLRTIFIGQRSSTDRTRGPVMFDAILSGPSITFVSIHLYTDCRAFLKFASPVNLLG